MLTDDGRCTCEALSGGIVLEEALGLSSDRLLMIIINRIKINDGGACDTYGGEVHTGIWWEVLRERDNFEDRGVDGPSRRGMWRHEMDRSGFG